ncbi:MAG: hypothetical protein AAGF01_23810 [Cyanobacteria bacterium P01_G01_bin.38]
MEKEPSGGIPYKTGKSFVLERFYFSTRGWHFCFTSQEEARSFYEEGLSIGDDEWLTLEGVQVIDSRLRIDPQTAKDG